MLRLFTYLDNAPRFRQWLFATITLGAFLCYIFLVAASVQLSTAIKGEYKSYQQEFTPDHGLVRAMSYSTTLDLQGREQSRTLNVNGSTFCLLPVSNAGEGDVFVSS